MMADLITLVLGGTRSGKSEVAEALAAGLGSTDGVTYIATAHRSLADEAFSARIDAHQSRRPQGWATIEVDGDLDLASALADAPGVALVDSVTTWVSAHAEFKPDIDAVIETLARRGAPVVLVSDEVGLGGYPATEMGSRFADELGRCNQRLASAAGRVLLVVAGRILELPPR